MKKFLKGIILKDGPTFHRNRILLLIRTGFVNGKLIVKFKLEMHKSIENSGNILKNRTKPNVILESGLN